MITSIRGPFLTKRPPAKMFPLADYVIFSLLDVFLRCYLFELFVSALSVLLVSCFAFHTHCVVYSFCLICFKALTSIITFLNGVTSCFCYFTNKTNLQKSSLRIQCTSMFP